MGALPILIKLLGIDSKAIIIKGVKRYSKFFNICLPLNSPYISIWM